MSTVHNLSPAELDALPAGVRRIDVREPAETAGPLGVLPGSELVPLGTLPGAAEGWARETPLLLVCRSGARSLKAAEQLAAQGFTRLYNLAGGMLAVRERGLPVEGPGVVARREAAEVREALCGAVRTLWAPRPAPGCEELFQAAGVPFVRPTRAHLLAALEAARARALAERLAPAGVEAALRPVRDLAALVPGPGEGA